MTIVLSEDSKIEFHPEAAHASTEVGTDPTVADDLEDFGLIRALFSVAALWGVIAVIGAIAGVIWSMP